MNKLSKTLLLILDGYGIAPAGPGNAATLADTPVLKRILAAPGGTSLAASGREVGLPEGYIGNSEVGHLNIGAGRIVYQDMPRIDLAIEQGDFMSNPPLVSLCRSIKAAKGKLHLLGLLSDGGVHSHINHVYALLQMAKEADIPAVVHAFLDGRDTPPTSGMEYVRALLDKLGQTGGQLGTMCGRYYAMDRDQRWERVNIAWNMLAHGQGEQADDPVRALNQAYSNGETDEFIKPRLVLKPDQAMVKDGDGLFFFNFRADRARELARAFFADSFAEFDRGRRPALSGLATMTSYDDDFPLPVAFPKKNLAGTMGETVSNLGLKQLRIAETEKYAHVTYFFNGGREEPFPGEDRILVPSPRDIATYDLKPEMSAGQVTDKLIAAWESGKYTFVVCNLANPDMVGHTGIVPAAVSALQTVDNCVQRIQTAVLASGGRLCITSDHGNVEKMTDENGRPCTAHTTNRTPLIILENHKTTFLKPGGKLGDIAPTILGLWQAQVPPEMTGSSLAQFSDANAPKPNIQV